MVIDYNCPVTVAYNFNVTWYKCTSFDRMCLYQCYMLVISTVIVVTMVLYRGQSDHQPWNGGGGVGGGGRQREEEVYRMRYVWILFVQS